MIFYDRKETIRICKRDPKIIFELINEKYTDVVGEVLNKNKDIINLYDSNGNSVMMNLLARKEYDLILKCVKYKNWDINYCNKDGNTFTHLLVTHDYLKVAKILDQIRKNKNFIPNIKNKNKETVLDMAIKSEKLCSISKILEDRRFNDIDIVSFKYLFDKYINNSYYGKYSKLNNLELVINNLEKKEKLKPRMKIVLNFIKNNKDTIKSDLLKNHSDNLDKFLESLI